MKIGLITHDLVLGGMQRATVNLVSQWLARGHEVTLVLTDASPRFYAPPTGVRVIELGLPSSYVLSWRRVPAFIRSMRAMRLAFNALEVDVAVVFTPELWSHIALLPGRRQTPAIMSMRVDPHTFPPYRNIGEALSRFAEPRADAVVALTDNARQYYLKRTRAPIHVIPNIVLPNAGATRLRGGRHIVSTGRLEKIKGYEALIRAFAKVHAAMPDSRLTIVGEGRDRDNLEALITSLGLSQSISLPGSTTDVGPALADADLFVLSSRSEAFSNALIEAMAAGLPIIATDCAGPLAVLTPGRNGLIVPIENVDALAGAMLLVLSDVALRRRLSESALETVSRYHPDRIMPLWDAAFRDAMQRQ